MAKKPVLEIDIDDTQFRSFYEMFQKYQDQVKEMPESWKGANEVLNAGIAAVVEQTHNISKNMHAAISAQKQFATATHHSLSGMKGLAHQAKSLSDSLFGAVKFVLKAGAWGGGLFAGALFGIDRLAGSALGSARSARGLGVNTGQLRAWRTDYAQVAPPALPESVYGAQRNMQDWAWLSLASGMPLAQAQQMNPVSLSQRLILQAHEYYQRNRDNPTMLSQNAARMQAFAAMGLNVEDVTRAGQTSRKDILAAQAQFAADQSTLRYGRSAESGLWAFQRQIKIAGQALETLLGQRLAKIGPALGSLITGLEKDASVLINGLLSDKNLESIKHGLNEFTNYITSGRMKASLQSFADSISDLSGYMRGLAGFFQKMGIAKDSVVQAIHQDQDFVSRKVYPSIAESIKTSPLGLGVKAANWFLSGGNVLRSPEWSERFNKADRSFGLPAGTMRALTYAESGGYPKATSKAGAQGLLQLMPSTARDLHVKNPYDPKENFAAGSYYFGQQWRLAQRLAPRASGMDHLQMAVAAYNWGPGNFEKEYKRSMAQGVDWQKGIPKESRDEFNRIVRNLPAQTRQSLDDGYLRQIARNTSQPVKVHVTMHTPAAARIAVSANAAR